MTRPRHHDESSPWPADREMMHFCRPEVERDSDVDTRLLSSAERCEIPFEGHVLQGYRWGNGAPVLLVHGWNSRASHLALLARTIAAGGFTALAFDGPAHGRSHRDGGPPRTNLPEFCRALSHVATRIGPLHGIVGHSFGAAAAVFTMAGHANLSGYRTEAARLVMISTPPSIRAMIAHYCRKRGFPPAAVDVLIGQLEDEFPIRVADYRVDAALAGIEAEVLVIHDRDDDEIAVTDIEAMAGGRPDLRLLLTSGQGHRKILASRLVLREVRSFLS